MLPVQLVGGKGGVLASTRFVTFRSFVTRVSSPGGKLCAVQCVACYQFGGTRNMLRLLFTPFRPQMPICAVALQLHLLGAGFLVESTAKQNIAKQHLVLEYMWRGLISTPTWGSLVFREIPARSRQVISLLVALQCPEGRGGFLFDIEPTDSLEKPQIRMGLAATKSPWLGCQGFGVCR